MATALELIEKQENYYKELQRLSDPSSYFEDHPDLKMGYEDVLNALPELYTDPSLLKNYDSDFAEELLFLVVFLPLSKMFDLYLREKGVSNIGVLSYNEEDEALARRLRSKLGTPNSKEMFRVLKEAKKPYDRDFYYNTVENPSILYRLQSSVEMDDFDSFDTLILEHSSELKLFFFCMLVFPLMTSFKSAMHSVFVDDSEESMQKALALLTSWSDFVARLEVFPESVMLFLRKMIDLMANILQVLDDDDDDYLRKLAIAFLRFFAFMSSELKFDEKEKAIFDRVLYNPFFPDLYTKCLKEIEAEIEQEKTKKELPDGQEQPEVTFVSLPAPETNPQVSAGEEKTGTTFLLPRGDKWKDCGFYKSSEDIHYLHTSLGAARIVNQEQIEDLFKTLVETGCIENKEDVLLTLAVRLTGRKLIPEPIPEIEWIGEKAEIDYLIFRLTPEKQSPEYSRYRHFFKDYDPNGAGRRVAKGRVREAVIDGLDKIMPKKDRPKF